MKESIITLIIMIIAIVAHIIKSIKEASETSKQQKPDAEDDLVIIARPKPGKQAKTSKQRSLTRQPQGEGLGMLDDSTKSIKRQALSKKLSPQGEGQRFDADPGTLDTAHIVAPTFDSTVKPELESITGIYEAGAVYTDRSKSAITLNIANYLTKPEGIIQAVLFAEILKRPAWQDESI